MKVFLIFGNFGDLLFCVAIKVPLVRHCRMKHIIGAHYFINIMLMRGPILQGHARIL